MKNAIHVTFIKYPTARGTASAMALVLGLMCLAFSVHAEEKAPEIVKEKDPTPSQSVSISGAYWRSALHTTAPILGGAVLASQGGLLSTVGGLSILYGAFIGPSIGNYYVNDADGGLGGIAWRAGGAAGTLVGFVIGIGCALSARDCQAQTPLIWVSLIGGGAAYVGGTIWQLSRIPRYARQKNRVGMEMSWPSVQDGAPGLFWNLSPTWDPTRQAIGAQFALRLTDW